eukprot:COSAG01_NODE_15964_length_1282_cov_1.962806_2_plen_63_part_01
MRRGGGGGGGTILIRLEIVCRAQRIWCQRRWIVVAALTAASLAAEYRSQAVCATGDMNEEAGG